MNLDDHRVQNSIAGNAFFATLGHDINDALDLHPEGITQERAWLHLKQVGRKASVDQIRVRLDAMTRAGELVATKNGKNETVWKRAARGGLVTAKPTQLIGETPSQTEIPRSVAESPERKSPVPTEPVNVAFIHCSGSPDAIPMTVGDRRFAVTSPQPEPAAQEAPPMTPPVDPPERPANVKPIVHSRRRGSGERIEAAVLEALDAEPRTRKQLMDKTGASGTGIDNALKRLADRVVRAPTGLWGLQGTAYGGAALQPAAPPRAKRSPGKREAWSDIEASLQRFTARLQPVEDLASKVLVLDQLITIVPAPIADKLTVIRSDFVRLAGG